MNYTDSKEIQRLIDKGLIKPSDRKVALAAVSKSVPSRRSSANHVSSEEKLFNLLKPIYGCYLDGGELVRELIPIKGRKYQLDVSLPRYGIYIEMDGIEGHAMFKDGQGRQHLNKAGFERDRMKSILLAGNNWVGFSAMKKHLSDNPDEILKAVACLCSSRERKDVEIDFESGAFPKLVH